MNRFTKEKKLEAVRFHLDNPDISLQKCAKQFNTSTTSIASWTRQYGEEIAMVDSQEAVTADVCDESDMEEKESNAPYQMLSGTRDHEPAPLEIIEASDTIVSEMEDPETIGKEDPRIQALKDRIIQYEKEITLLRQSLSYAEVTGEKYRQAIRSLIGDKIDSGFKRGLRGTNFKRVTFENGIIGFSWDRVDHCDGYEISYSTVPTNGKEKIICVSPNDVTYYNREMKAPVDEISAKIRTVAYSNGTKTVSAWSRDCNIRVRKTKCYQPTM